MLTPEFNSPWQLNSMKSTSNRILLLDMYIKEVGLLVPEETSGARASLNFTKTLCQEISKHLII